MITFENSLQKLPKIQKYLNMNGITSLEDAQKICLNANVPVMDIVKKVQNISFVDAGWAYTAGAAVALRKKLKSASEISLELGNGLQAFCLDGSVAEERKVGLGHGQLAAKILTENTNCFAFLAGHESFAAAQGALGIINSANRVRKNPLRVILLGLGKDAAEIISRINGFTYVQTKFNYENNVLRILEEVVYSKRPSSLVRCYGVDDVREGVAVMEYEDVDVSITGNGTNMVRFTHLVAATYKKLCQVKEKEYFAVASGGGIGRTLGPDETSAGPASYGLTDSMSRMWGDTTFAGSSSVPAHVAMMGFVGMGNNPMVGATVSIAVKIFNMREGNDE